MALGGIFGKLFGGGNGRAGAEKRGDPVEYQGYTIIPAPKSQDGQFLTAGIIRKETDGETLEASFIRADTHQSFDAACQHAVSKGQQIINEQGERLFRSRTES